MYKDEALFLLKGGKEGILEWNRQVASGKANLDLGGTKLPAAKLMGANLRGADLRRANLHGARLGGAKLSIAQRLRWFLTILRSRSSSPQK
ncbi:MAG: pentapeptide repeat-containing protein [Isosphaeraceae bacterium]